MRDLRQKECKGKCLYYWAGRPLSQYGILLRVKEDDLHSAFIRGAWKGVLLKMQIEIQTGGGIMTGIVCFFLVLCSVSDIRKKEIPLSVVITAFVLAAGFTVWEIGKGERSLAPLILFCCL